MKKYFVLDQTDVIKAIADYCNSKAENVTLVFADSNGSVWSDDETQPTITAKVIIQSKGSTTVIEIPDTDTDTAEDTENNNDSNAL